MRRLTTVTGAGIAALALSFALVGCGSDTKTEAATSSTTTSKEETSKTSTAAAEPAAPPETGTHRTIQDYVKENGIQETVIKRGDPGPTIDLPVPEGWEATQELPEAPYGAIVYQGTAVPANPPRILAILSRLTGNVDPAQILALAPGELQNIPGYDGPTDGERDALGGYDAVQLGGNYDVNGKKGMIAQKTVVIPGQDGLYVLQLNAYSDESEAGILGDATNVVDEQTTITP
jgi:Probable lipoprotein LpqN